MKAENRFDYVSRQRYREKFQRIFVRYRVLMWSVASSTYASSFNQLPLIIMASKQDVPNARSCREVAAALQFDDLESSLRPVNHACHPMCALTGEGVEEAMVWLVDQMGASSSSSSTPSSSS